ncbi:hypothetical protein [Streptomyces sp. CBG33]|uniref:hypothetical protein n=1 Tax=unclassified Streptomyces TaxID=2593676 RepID=UPI001644170C|nr:hypothetical protein [Streptomyces sp. CBG33]
MDEARRTVLYLLATRRSIRSHRAFSEEYHRAARQLSSEGYDVAPPPGARHYERLLTVGGVKTAPHGPTARVLERMFQRPVGDLLRPAAEVAADEHDKPAELPSPHVLNESDLLMTARDAASHSGEAAALRLDGLTLDQLTDDLVALSRAYARTAPADVFHEARGLLQRAQVGLERTRSPEQHTRLYYAAAQASALLAAVSFDLGAMAPTVSFARSAAQYGRTIDNGPVQAYAYGVLAYAAFWSGRPAEAVRLTRTAQQMGGLGDTARRRLYAIEARAHGHLRAEEQAQRAIRSADEPAPRRPAGRAARRHRRGVRLRRRPHRHEQRHDRPPPAGPGDRRGVRQQRPRPARGPAGDGGTPGGVGTGSRRPGASPAHARGDRRS